MWRCSQKLLKRHSLLHVQRPTILDAQNYCNDSKQVEEERNVCKKESIPFTDVTRALPTIVDRPSSSQKILSTLYSQHKQSLLLTAKTLLPHGFRGEKSGRTVDDAKGGMEWWVFAALGIWFYGIHFRPTQMKKHFSFVQEVFDSHHQLLRFPQCCPSTYVRYGLAAKSKRIGTHILPLPDSVVTQGDNVKEPIIQTSPIDAACAALKDESDKCTGALLNLYAMVYQRRKEYMIAFQLFTAASEKGHIPSLYNIGVCYEKGHGVDSSLKNAAKYFKEAADEGHTEAMWNVGTFHYERKGYFDEETDELGFKYMKAAADKGHVQACSFVALKYAREENWDEAFNYFNKAAEKEDRTSLFNLALCLENGLGTYNDVVRAGQCYLRAAQLGDPASQLRVGEAHMHGTRGMKKDLKEALRWLQLAAENGCKNAEHAVQEVQGLIAKEKMEPDNIFSFLSGGEIVIPVKDNKFFQNISNLGNSC